MCFRYLDVVRFSHIKCLCNYLLLCRCRDLLLDTLALRFCISPIELHYTSVFKRRETKSKTYIFYVCHVVQIMVPKYLNSIPTRQGIRPKNLITLAELNFRINLTSQEILKYVRSR